MSVPPREERLADVRRWQRVTVPGPSFGQRADAVYTAVLVAAIFGTIGFHAAHANLSQVLSLRGTAAWGPAVVALVLVLTARWGGYQGPVVYAPADVAHLLGAPLSRRGLALRKLAAGLAGGALAGGLVGAIALVGLEGNGRHLAAARAAGLVAGAVLVGVLGVSAAWGTQASGRIERTLLRGGRVLLLATIAAGIVGAGDADVRRVVRWTGPWGWAVAPVSGPAWPLALALLLVTTAGLATLALVRCGSCPTERHASRAEARAGASAALASFDARQARRSLASVTTPGRRRRRSTGRGASRSAAWVRRHPRWLLAWRGLVVLGRRPGAAVELLVLAGGGVAIVTAAGDEPAAALAGGILVYVAAARALEPLRQEIDAPGRTTIMLRATYGRVLVGHAVLPALLLGLAALVGAGAVTAAGASAGPAGGVAIAALAGAPAATLAAALSARRGGRLSQNVLGLANSDTSGAGSFLVIGWLLAWPLAGAVLTAGPAVWVALGGAADLIWALAALGVVSYVLYAVLLVTERP